MISNTLLCRGRLDECCVSDNVSACHELLFMGGVSGALGEFVWVRVKNESMCDKYSAAVEKKQATHRATRLLDRLRLRVHEAITNGPALHLVGTVIFLLLRK